MSELIKKMICFKSINNKVLKNKMIECIGEQSIIFNSIPETCYSNFITDVSKLAWFEYQNFKRDESKIKEYYMKAYNFLPEKIKNICKFIINSRKYINYVESSDLSDEEVIEYYTYMINNKCEIDEIIEILISLKQESKFNNVFTSIEKNLNTKKKINCIIFGRPCSGKDSIISTSYRYFINPDISRLSRSNKLNLNIGNLEINFEVTNFVNKDSKIIYTLDFSQPRLDVSDYNLLTNLIIQMKRFKSNLDYWKNVIIVCSKTNNIKLNKYERYGGFPKYNRRKSNMTIKDYNKTYSKTIYQAMSDWKDSIENRKFKKIYDSTVRFGDQGQSLLVYLKEIAKTYYPSIKTTEIDEIVSKIPVIFINDEYTQGDIIRPIPNFDDALNENFEDRLYDFKKKQLTLDSNWVSSLYNLIYYSFT